MALLCTSTNSCISPDQFSSVAAQWQCRCPQYIKVSARIWFAFISYKLKVPRENYCPISISLGSGSMWFQSITVWMIAIKCGKWSVHAVFTKCNRYCMLYWLHWIERLVEIQHDSTVSLQYANSKAHVGNFFMEMMIKMHSTSRSAA